MEWHEEIQQKLDEVNFRLNDLISKPQAGLSLYPDEADQPTVTTV